MKNHSIDNTPTAPPPSQNDGNIDIPQPTTLTTVEGQEDGSSPAGYKYADLGTILALNSIREKVDLIDQGVPPNFVPWTISRLTQASAEVITWLVREEEN